MVVGLSASAGAGVGDCTEVDPGALTVQNSPFGPLRLVILVHFEHKMLVPLMIWLLSHLSTRRQRQFQPHA